MLKERWERSVVGRVKAYAGIGVIVLAVVLVSALSCLGEEGPACPAFVRPGESVQQAIDAAPEGGLICLDVGVWRETIAITKSLTIRGQGLDKTRIGSISIGGEGIEVIIEGIGALSLSTYSCFYAAPVVRIEDCVISANEGRAIELYGSTRATITDCVISANELSAIELYGSARATITDCTISGGEYAEGIALRDHASAVIEGCTISGVNGIDLGNDASATVVDNVIEGCEGYGIGSFSEGQVQGSGNLMRKNGVDLVGNLPGDLRNPLVEATEEEILYPDARYPSLQEAIDALLPGGRLVLRGGEYAGGLTIGKKIEIVGAEGEEVTLTGGSYRAPIISVVGGGKLQVDGLKLTDGGTGVRLSADGRATITHCTISGEEGDGIVIRNSASATIVGCTVQGRLCGVSVGDTAKASVEDSIVSENRSAGILLSDGATADMMACTVSGNVRDGILLEGSSVATVSGGTISENGNIGVGVRQSAEARIEGCMIRANGLRGIFLTESARATVADCVIHENGFYGLFVCHSAEAVVTGCSIVENAVQGIALYEEAHAMISGCTVQDNDYGVYMRGSAEATLEGNTIAGNRVFGVVLCESRDECSCITVPPVVFTGFLSGSGNTIERNGKRDVCPDELDFLTTEAGGELDSRE